MSGWSYAVASAVAVASFCMPARATNGLHPRTKVVWDAGGTCGLTVVRREQSEVVLPYSLPDANQDGMLDGCDDDPTPDGCGPNPVNAPIGPDEVEDSRRHQFFAFCRQRPLDELLPNWISDADVQVSSTVETCCDVNECPGPMCALVDPAALAPDDVLDTDPSWQGCFTRIDADDDRRPITVAQAEQGIAWDVSGVEPGVYALEGYTWEPPFNDWSRRPGFVKVVDDAEDAASYPAAAIMSASDEVDEDRIIDGCETITLRGCVDAAEGATLALFWKHIGPGEPIAWHRVLADEPVKNGDFEIEWSPENLPPGTLLLRVDVTDACGTYTAHAPLAFDVLDKDQCEDGAVFADAEAESGEPDDFVDDQDNRDENVCAGETGAGEDESDTRPGCGCSTQGLMAGLPLLALVPLVLGGRRRSRRLGSRDAA